MAGVLNHTEISDLSVWEMIGVLEVDKDDGHCRCVLAVSVGGRLKIQVSK